MPRYRRVFDHDEIFLLKFNESIVGFSTELLKTAERNLLFEQCEKLVEVFINIVTEMLDICCTIISTRCSCRRADDKDRIPLILESRIEVASRIVT